MVRNASGLLQIGVDPPQTGGNDPLSHQKPGERLDAVAGTGLGGLVVAHRLTIGVDQLVIRHVSLLGPLAVTGRLKAALPARHHWPRARRSNARLPVLCTASLRSWALRHGSRRTPASRGAARLRWRSAARPF